MACCRRKMMVHNIQVLDRGRCIPVKWHVTFNFQAVFVAFHRRLRRDYLSRNHLNKKNEKIAICTAWERRPSAVVVCSLLQLEIGNYMLTCYVVEGCARLFTIDQMIGVGVCARVRVCDL
jgi:hypothetical protein